MATDQPSKDVEAPATAEVIQPTMELVQYRRLTRVWVAASPVLLIGLNGLMWVVHYLFWSGLHPLSHNQLGWLLAIGLLVTACIVCISAWSELMDHISGQDVEAWPWFLVTGACGIIILVTGYSWLQDLAPTLHLALIIGGWLSIASVPVLMAAFFLMSDYEPQPGPLGFPWRSWWSMSIYGFGALFYGLFVHSQSVHSERMTYDTVIQPAVYLLLGILLAFAAPGVLVLIRIYRHDK